MTSRLCAAPRFVATLPCEDSATGDDGLCDPCRLFYGFYPADHPMSLANVVAGVR